jgi:FeS assembly SUF system regulator
LNRSQFIAFMLRLSKLTDYGTVIMTFMARTKGLVHSANEIAEQVGIAAPTVSKVLKMLARYELVVSTRGAKGGYVLARPATEITMAEIISAMEGGPLGLTECSTTPGACIQERSCSIRTNWQRINQVIVRALEEVSLAEMTRPVAQPIRIRDRESSARRGRALA